MFSQRSNHPFRNALLSALSLFRVAVKYETMWRAFLAGAMAMVVIYRVELGAAIHDRVSQIALLQPEAAGV